MPKKRQYFKYLHILPADTDVTYWFIKTLRKSPDFSEHRFLIAANEKTVLKKYTKLLEFTDLLFLVGGTEGKDGKKRYALLKEYFDSAETIVWHGIRFDTIDILKVLHRNRKANKKSIWICQSSEISFFSALKNDSFSKKIRRMVSLFKKICCSEEYVIPIVAKIFGLNSENILYTPYLIDPNIFSIFSEMIEIIKRDSKLSSEEMASLTTDEQTEDNIIEDIDDLYDYDEDEDEEQKIKPLTFQFDFSPISSESNIAMLKSFFNIDLKAVKLIVPSDIWLNGTKVIKSKISPAMKVTLDKIFGNQYIIYNHSYAPKTYFDYVNELDAVIVCSDIIIKPVYLYLAIALNKIIFISTNSPYKDLLQKLNANIMYVEDINSETFNNLRMKQTDFSSNEKSVECFFDFNYVIQRWSKIFNY